MHFGDKIFMHFLDIFFFQCLQATLCKIEDDEEEELKEIDKEDHRD